MITPIPVFVVDKQMIQRTVVFHRRGLYKTIEQDVKLPRKDYDLQVRFIFDKAR